MKTRLYFCLAWMLFHASLFGQFAAQSPNGITFPSFTSAQRDAQLGSSSNGTVIFNTTTNLLELKTGNIWKALALPVCFTETISPTSASVYRFSSGNSTTLTDITPSISISNISNVIVYGLPTGITSTTTAASPVYHVNLTITPASVVGSYPVSIMSSSNCGLSNVSTFNLTVNNCNYSNCNGNCINTQSDINNCGSCGNVAPNRPNAVATCTAGTPGYICNSGYADCNGLATDGCEVNIFTNFNNCGACGVVPPNRPNATATCTAGTPGYICNSGYADCNGLATDGCEVNLTNNPQNCGSCGNTCPTGHSCVGGVCN